MAFLAVFGVFASRQKDKLADAESEAINAAHRVAIANADARAAEANKQAQQAIADAAKSNERAAAIESTNLALRTQLVEVEAKLKPRTISLEQRNEFLEVVNGRPRGPVKVLCADPSPESGAFAAQLRQLLDEAGFALPDNQGVKFVQRGYYAMQIGEVKAATDLAIVFHGEKKNINWPGIKFEWVGEMVALHFDPMDARAIPGSINEALKKLGFKITFQGVTNKSLLKEGEWVLLVHDRIH